MEFEERLLQAINKLMNLSRGTLWIVKDQIWAKAIENFVLQRKAHPGLAIGKRSFLSLQDTMPMLLGTSRSLPRFCRSGCLAARDWPKDLFQHHPPDVSIQQPLAVRPGNRILRVSSQYLTQ